jgi:hypothetical protein
MARQRDEDDDEGAAVREADLLGLAAAAARLRALVAGNEARMRQLHEFVQRLNTLLDTASDLEGTPPAPGKVAGDENDNSGC